MKKEQETAACSVLFCSRIIAGIYNCSFPPQHRSSNWFPKVNTATKPDDFRLPCMEDCIDQVGQAKYTTQFNLPVSGLMSLSVLWWLNLTYMRLLTRIDPQFGQSQKVQHLSFHAALWNVEDQIKSRRGIKLSRTNSLKLQEKKHQNQERTS